MTVYFWPVQQLTIAPGSDIATETTQLLIEGHVSTIDTNTGTIATNTGNINTQITNFDRNTGAAGTTTLRSVLATRHETKTTPLAARLSNGTEFVDAVAQAASQTTFSTTAASLQTLASMCGWDGSAHREVLLDSGGRTLLSTRHEAVATPFAARLSDGTDFIVAGAIAAAQKTVSTATKALDVVSFMLGWDTVTHRELLLDTNGAVRIAAADLVAMKPEYAKAIVPVLLNFATSGITASAYTQVIASTAAKATRWQFTNTSSSHISVATGAGGAEAPFAIIPPGGAAEIDISIASSTRISVTSDENVNTGKFSVSAFV